MAINKVGVIGAGLMGSGIAAQITNAGIPVVLLDIVPEGADDRSVLAKSAVQKMLKTEPASFMHKDNAKLVSVGNIEDDIEQLSDCDWIIEVVLEDLKIKHATYEKIIQVRKKGSIVSSNTSSIPLQQLTEPFGDEFAKDFMITHFFNPPRYMRLLELVTGEKTRKDATDEIAHFCDVRLGKGVVVCNDTPGFIANRLGVFWLQCGINDAFELGISIEAADAVMSRPVGIPKTGIFGLCDLVGIDLLPHLTGSLLSSLPEKDWYRDLYKDFSFIKKMIEAGYTGRKGKGGFYRLDPEAKGRVKQALAIEPDSFSEDSYAKADKPSMPSISAGRKGLRAVVESDDIGGQYAWAVLSKTLAYAASLVPEIADDIYSVDEAMKLGYNWKKGPFEMIDALGPKWFAEKLAQDGVEVPELVKKVGDGAFYKIENGKIFQFGTDGKYHEIVRPEGVLLLSDVKLSSEPVMKNGSASVWDIGDGVLCFEKTSKMNTFDEQIFGLMNKTIKTIGDGSGDYKAMVIYNEASNFSAGANLGLALYVINLALWPQIDQFVAAGQQTFKALKHAPFPVISAPSGMALGGGCEVLLHSDHIQAHAETYTGLVEVGVGLVPGWGGCKEMILRFRERQEKQFKDNKVDGASTWFSPANDPMSATRKAFETIGTAQVAKSASEAVSMGYFKDSDAITMNRDRLLYDAKQKALEMSKDYTAPEPIEDIRLPGASGKAALDLAVKDMHKSGVATDYDLYVSDLLATILSGGDADWTEPVNENHLLALELEIFKKLVKSEGTMDRIEHMLNTGKPLRN